jgi:hypothetical protein
MNLYKSIIITVLFSCEALAFANTIKINNKLHKLNKNVELVKMNLNRREICGIFSILQYIPLPFLITKHASAFSPKKEKTIEELKEEAMKIIEIIEVQKNTINLPSLKDNNVRDDKGNKDDKDDKDGKDGKDNKDETDYNVNSKTKIKIDGVLNNIMNNFKKNGYIDPEKSISNLQNYCSKSNIIKYKNTKRLTSYFQDGKYALFLGKFINYEIIDYQRDVDNNSDEKNNVYYTVNMKVTAEYKTMLQNSIQFNDMYYPKNRDYNNICYVIYRWSFKKYEDDNLYLEGCYLVPPTTAS